MKALNDACRSPAADEPALRYHSPSWRSACVIIVARLDALSPKLTDLMEMAKGDVLTRVNTAFGILPAKLDALSATSLEIREYVAKILRAMSGELG